MICNDFTFCPGSLFCSIFRQRSGWNSKIYWFSCAKGILIIFIFIFGAFDMEFLRFFLQTQFESFDSKQWWEQHQLIFPRLFRIFLRTYATPASSASSERAFSTTGRTLDARRISLKPSTVNQLMLNREFYRHNAKKWF